MKIIFDAPWIEGKNVFEIEGICYQFSWDKRPTNITIYTEDKETLEEIVKFSWSGYEMEDTCCTYYNIMPFTIVGQKEVHIQ